MADPLEQLRSWTATAAAGVTSAAGLIASAEPADQPFAWASVTKLLVALAELDAAQCGLIDLDEPAGPGRRSGTCCRTPRNSDPRPG